MARMMKVVIAHLLVSLFILQLVESDNMVTTTPLGGSLTPASVDCGGECNRRCAKSSRPNLCKRACGTCCQRCGCVPSSTAGHYEECACYAAMKTHRGERKCP